MKSQFNDFSAGYGPGHGGPEPSRAAIGRAAEFVAERLARMPHGVQAEIAAFPTGAAAGEFAQDCAREWEATK